MTSIKMLVFCCCYLLTSLAQAGPVMNLEIEGDFDGNYVELSSQLEAQRLWVVFEPNIGGSLASFKERWGEDYNRHGFSEIRSMVFCNPWYANQVINKDPEMASLCPLSITLLQKGDVTQVKFLRPSQIKPDSPAQPVLEELEATVVKALQAAGAKLSNTK